MKKALITNILEYKNEHGESIQLIMEIIEDLIVDYEIDLAILEDKIINREYNDENVEALTNRYNELNGELVYKKEVVKSITHELMLIKDTNGIWHKCKSRMDYYNSINKN